MRRVSEAEEDALQVRFKLLGEILRNADIVSLHVPLTAASRHMIGAAEARADEAQRLPDRTPAAAR
ncbi:NAD(P)-dependent oxidoreductase [Dankookia sp. P2]|uniref:NAD(P)-dependent oxidoreductase n=1 Tax=Dankookia sp. P2 TaxID=3423955 RepID=UPI003D66B616